MCGAEGIKNNYFPGVCLQPDVYMDGSFPGPGGGALKHEKPVGVGSNSPFLDNPPSIPHQYYKLKLNGHDRFYKRDSHYFNLTQVWKHHTGYGSPFPVSSVYVYSFALKPEEHQPSGTCNFSRIDSATLDMENVEKYNNGSNVPTYNSPVNEINIYAINYNVLRIMSGMGGLAYSN